jgi:hypothetical protein
METKTIQSWIYKNVRIREEYITKEKEIDEDASTYDDDDNIIEEVYRDVYYLTGMGADINNMSCYFRGRERDVFEVKYSFYGTNLYNFQNEKVGFDMLPEPEHLFIIDSPNVPYIWKAKYFEVVKAETIYVVDKEFNNN